MDPGGSPREMLGCPMYIHKCLCLCVSIRDIGGCVLVSAVSEHSGVLVTAPTELDLLLPERR